MPTAAPESHAANAFPKSLRMLRRAEFRVAQTRGRRIHATHFVLILDNREDDGPGRLGITTARKVGSAVRRNRVRRLVREVFRLHKGSFPVGHDCVVIARENAPELDFPTVRDELLAALTRRRERSATRAVPSSRGPGTQLRSTGAGPQRVAGAKIRRADLGSPSPASPKGPRPR